MRFILCDVGRAGYEMGTLKCDTSILTSSGFYSILQALILLTGMHKGNAGLLSDDSTQAPWHL